MVLFMDANAYYKSSMLQFHDFKCSPWNKMHEICIVSQPRRDSLLGEVYDFDQLLPLEYVDDQSFFILCCLSINHVG